MLKKKKSYAIICLVIIILSLVYTVVPHFNRNDYSVYITGKEVKRKNDKDIYLIYAKDKSNRVYVFENSDSLLEFKFNSSDLYATINIGDRYKLSTYGWRIKWISMYENILDIDLP